MSQVKRAPGAEGAMQRVVAIGSSAERKALQGPTSVLADRVPFVGRERELGDLRKRYESAVSGQGSVVLLSGEPGIGKTRLVEELARYAIRRGGRAVWGQCWDGAEVPVLWPWIQVLRDYAAECDAEIRDLIPTLGLSTPSVADPDGRFHLFDAVTAFLKRAAAAQPLVVVLDDLHRADSVSLDLLQFLAAGLRETRLLVVATYRYPRAPRATDLSRILGGLACERRYLPLRALSEVDVETFIEEMAGVSPSVSAARHIARTSEGNPFFMRELVQALLDDGELRDGAELPATSQRIPLGVRDAVRRDLDALSRLTRDTLSIASVLGREFSLKRLESACGAGDVDLIEALQEALSYEIIAEVSSGRYRFAHALVREVLYDDLCPRRRNEVLESVDVEASTVRLATRPSGESSQSNAFLRAGDHWAISFEGSTFHLRDSIGLRYIAYLLQNPGRKIPSVDLVLFAEGTHTDTISKGDVEVGLNQRRGFGDAGEMIDHRAEQAYRRRWEELEAELRRAKACNDLGQVECLAHERNFLLRELTAGFDLHGRTRQAASFSERARLNVTRAIRSAIDRVGEYDRPLATHFRATIETGRCCSYVPDSATKRWAVVPR